MLRVLIPVLLLMVGQQADAMSVSPDSLRLDVQPMMDIFDTIGTVHLEQSSPGDSVVDSVFVRLLDGDSADFVAGAQCDDTSFACHLYGGWVFGDAPVALSYVRDSLFLLVDTTGTPLTIRVPVDTGADFALRTIVNCPVCGRMPSFPATTTYEYTFVARSGLDAVAVVTTTTTAVVRLPTGKRTVTRTCGGACLLDGRTVSTSGRQAALLWLGAHGPSGQGWVGGTR